VRRSIAALLGLGLLWLATGCQGWGGQDGRPHETHLQEILARGTLRAGLSGGQPPLNMIAKDGSVIGFEVDIVLSLAKSMGIEAEFVPMPFATLLGSLERGDVDLVISGMTMTAERNARVAFVGPYFVSGKSILTRSERLENVERVVDLNQESITYTALAGSTSERFVREVLPNAMLIVAPDYDTAIAKVISGEAHAMVGDYPVCAYQAAARPEAGLIALSTPFTTEPLGIALPPDDALFVNLVQNHLTMLKETGLLTQFKVKWFSDAAYLRELR
jgi:polar amino acid transport system substrate-binding protein